MLASAALQALGMEFGVLVQRDRKRRVRVAEHMPAVAAMVPSLQEREGGLAHGCITDQSVGVGLPVLARGRASYGAEVVGWHGGLVFGDFPEGSPPAVGGGASAYGAAGGGAVEAVGAAVDAAGWCKGRGAVGSFGGAQDGGDVHGGFGLAEVVETEDVGGLWGIILAR